MQNAPISSQKISYQQWNHGAKTEEGSYADRPPELQYKHSNKDTSQLARIDDRLSQQQKPEISQMSPAEMYPPSYVISSASRPASVHGEIEKQAIQTYINSSIQPTHQKFSQRSSVDLDHMPAQSNMKRFELRPISYDPDEDQEQLSDWVVTRLRK